MPLSIRIVLTPQTDILDTDDVDGCPAFQPENNSGIDVLVRQKAYLHSGSRDRSSARRPLVGIAFSIRA